MITHLDNETAAVVRFGPVLYVLWRAYDSLAAVGHCDEAVRALTSRYGRGRNLFYVHRAPGSSSGHGQSDKTRDAVMKHFDRTEPYFRGSAIIIEATGFIGAMVRSVAAGVTLIRRSAVKSKVFDDVGPGVRWLATMGDEASSFEPDVLMAELGERGLCRVAGLDRELPGR